MHMHRTMGVVLAGAAAVLCAACSQDLNVTNPNQPNQAEVLATPQDLQNLAVSDMNSWYLGVTHYDPWVMLNVTGDLMTMNYGNFGARFNNLEPRAEFNNATTSGDEEATSTPWTLIYRAIGGSNDVIRSVNNGLTLPGGTSKYEALAYFAQAASFTTASLIWDQAIPADENFIPGTTPVTFASYDSMAAFARGKIDKLIAMTDTENYSYDQSAEFPASFTAPPGNWSTGSPEGTGWTSAQMNRVLNTMGAQLLAYTPRNASEAANVDWAAVLAYAQKGIGALSTGGPAEDFAVQGDGGNTWYPYITLYFDLPSWMMIDLRLIHQMAPNVPNKYYALPNGTTTAGYDSVWAPDTSIADKRLGIDLTNVNRYVAGTDDKTDYVYARQVQGDPGRGIWMQSPYYQVRYIGDSFQANNCCLLPQPYILAAENDLLQADADVHLGTNLAQAAQLINNTRVNRGGLAPVSATDSPASLELALTYELEVECDATDGYGFFALRQMDGTIDSLQTGTVRSLPVPALELQTDLLPVYTFGGPSDPSGTTQHSVNLVPAIGGAGGQLSFNLAKFQAGPWKQLNLPNGQTMQIPVPHPTPVSRPGIRN